MRALSVGTFYQVDGGMDSPWRHLGERLGVRTDLTVERVTPVAGGVEGPWPVASRSRTTARSWRYRLPSRWAWWPRRPCQQRSAKWSTPRTSGCTWRGAASARRAPGIHAFPNETVATVELGNGGDGAWGRVPAGWEWALIGAGRASSGALLELSDDELHASGRQARRSTTACFRSSRRRSGTSSDGGMRYPKVGVGYFGRLHQLPQRPPIVFAGDWLVQPCVEGAVRSGNAAAAAFGAAKA